MVDFGIGDDGFQTIISSTSETLSGDAPLYTVALDGDGTFQLEGGYFFIGLSESLVDQKHLVRREEGIARRANKNASARMQSDRMRLLLAAYRTQMRNIRFLGEQMRALAQAGAAGRKNVSQLI